MTGSSPRSTDAQIDLARTVATRHAVRLPQGFESDVGWTRRFLDVFAFDPETELDVYRRIRNIEQWCREGRTPAEMARKLDLSPEDVGFIVAVLRDSGYDLTEVEEDLDEDPEEAWYGHIESDSLYY